MMLTKNNLSDPWRRILVDVVWVAMVYACIFIGLFTFMIPLIVLLIISCYLYFWRAQTPAMYLFKMRVVSLKTGEQATPLTMLLRELVVLVISLAVVPSGGLSAIFWIACVIPMFFNSYRQELWDLVVGTTVVDDPVDIYRRNPSNTSKSPIDSFADDLDFDL